MSKFRWFVRVPKKKHFFSFSPPRCTMKQWLWMDREKPHDPEDCWVDDGDDGEEDDDDASTSWGELIAGVIIFHELCKSDLQHCKSNHFQIFLKIFQQLSTCMH